MQLLEARIAPSDVLIWLEAPEQVQVGQVFEMQAWASSEAGLHGAHLDLHLPEELRALDYWVHDAFPLFQSGELVPEANEVRDAGGSAFLAFGAGHLIQEAEPWLTVVAVAVAEGEAQARISQGLHGAAVWDRPGWTVVELIQPETVQVIAEDIQQQEPGKHPEVCIDRACHYC